MRRLQYNNSNDYIIPCCSSDRISMTYVAGLLFHTSSASPNTIFIAPSNFSSFSSSDYQLAVGYYSISADAGDINIRSIIANQTSQQFLPGDQSSCSVAYIVCSVDHMITRSLIVSLIDNVELDVTTVRPSVPVNIRLDDSSTPTLINITWDMVEGVSPAIITYKVTYSLSRVDGSTENSTLQVK